MRGRVGTLIVCAVVLWTSGASLAHASTDGGARLLVAFADDASAADREAALQAIGGTIEGAIPAIAVTRVVTATEHDADKLWVMEVSPDFPGGPEVSGPLYPPTHAVMFAPLGMLPPKDWKYDG